MVRKKPTRGAFAALERERVELLEPKALTHDEDRNEPIVEEPAIQARGRQSVSYHSTSHYKEWMWIIFGTPALSFVLWLFFLTLNHFLKFK